MVNLSKGINPNQLPKNMLCQGKDINRTELSEKFVNYFEDKVKRIVASREVDNKVYNGKKKVSWADKNFMCLENIVRAFKSIKIKNYEGYNRIPQRILNKGMKILFALFNFIYKYRVIPEQ